MLLGWNLIFHFPGSASRSQGQYIGILKLDPVTQFSAVLSHGQFVQMDLPVTVISVQTYHEEIPILLGDFTGHTYL